MTDTPNRTPELKALKPIDRRRFVGGLGLMTVGGFGAPAAIAQTPEPAAAAPAAEQLALQTRRAQRWAGPEPADWVRPRAGADHNVVIVGGGQSGIALAYGLKRGGVGRVEVIDRAAPGQAGIWRTIARMDQLRTGKTLIGPEQDNPTLGFRAWYETQNGPEAFDALDRIPRLAWADYVDWFQAVTGTAVRYRTRLVEIEPAGALLRLHLDVEGVRRVETTRKLVLANGYSGAGGANLPDFLQALPAELWSHTESEIPFGALAGKVVGVIGAGSSAFDAAAVALERGAAEVHMLNRRAYVGYPGGSAPSGPSDPGHPGARELAFELPDVVRWRNFLRGERSVATVPLDSIERAIAFANFRLHLETSLTDVALADGGIAARVAGEARRFDHLISGTGYRIDLAAQPELAGIHAAIARWGDRYDPEAGESDAAGALHPYLGAGFELQPREGSGAAYLRNIHCFNLAARLSFGMLIGDIPSAVTHARLVGAIARDLYVDSVDVAAHRRFVEAPLTAPDPAPYERAVVPRARAAA